MQHKSALNLSSFRWKFLHLNIGKVCLKQFPGCSKLSTHPHILYILSVDIWIIWIDKVGIMNDSFTCVIYAVHLKIANLRRYSIGLPLFYPFSVALQPEKTKFLSHMFHLHS